MMRLVPISNSMLFDFSIAGLGPSPGRLDLAGLGPLSGIAFAQLEVRMLIAQLEVSSLIAQLEATTLEHLPRSK